jgi:type II secretory ATPase GspE/PulE/Tfp pilus assembly ATPase PilB-like protein
VNNPARLRLYRSEVRKNTMLELKSIRKFLGKEKTQERPAFFDYLSRFNIGEEELARHFQAGNHRPFTLEPFYLGSLGRKNWFQGLKEQYEVDPFDLQNADVSPQVAGIVHRELSIAHRLTCVEASERGLTLGMLDPSDDLAVAAVEEKTDFKVVKRVAVLGTDLTSFLEVMFGSARVLEVSPRAIVDEVIQRAVDQGASDVHFEPLEDELIIRFRKDGLLINSLDAKEFAPKKILMQHLKAALPVVVKNKSGAAGKTMNIAETQKAQDGRIYLPSGGIDMRVSVLPTSHGESIVIRIHRPGEGQSLQDLGFSPHVLERFENLVSAPHGIFLVSGPTGSGKTTTLYTVLRRLNSPEKKLLTIEDPVEYNVPGVVQVQTSEAKGVTFASTLRNFLRHDPDIIMVGEIRDKETAVMAVEASLTGHLVLSTVHANDAVRTITRIRDLGVNPKLITSTCLGTMAQRLVRLNCPHCQAKAALDDRLLKLASRYNVELDPDKISAGRGCPECNGTGFKGRTAIHELMVMSPELCSMVEDGAADLDLERVARQQGMRLLVEDALDKVAGGLTTVEEMRRVTMV